MWQLNCIQAYNFMSFEKVYFDFQNKCYVIRGENHDNTGQASNGGGKTSFVDIIAIGLLGYSLTGRNVKDCVNWSTDLDHFIVKILLVHSTTKQQCFVERKIYNSTKSAELSILIDEKVPTTIPTKKGVVNGVDTKEGNKYILNDILDIKEDDLLNYFLISKSHYAPFLSVNTDRKLEVISRFSKAQVVDKVISKLENDIKEVQKLKDQQLNTIATIEGYITALTDSLSEDKQQIFELNKQQQLDSITQNTSSVQNQLLELDEDINDTKLVIEAEELRIQLVDPKQKIELQKHHDSFILKGSLEFEDLLIKEISQAKNYLAGLIKCPKCKHSFNLTIKEEYTQDSLKALELGLKETREEIKKIEETKKQIKQQIQSIEDIERSNKQIRSHITSLTNNILSIEQQQGRLLKEIDNLEFRYATQAALTFVDQQADIQQQIEQKQKELQFAKNTHEGLIGEIDYTLKWISNFADFKFYLGNKPIELICSLVNQYLKLNGSDLNLHIEGFKTLRSGELRQALQPVIYRNWTNPQSFHQLSAGEQVRLNLAVDLSFQQLINSASKMGGLDLYISDEMINSLDSQGVHNAASAFNELGKTILLVTHSGSDLVYPNTIVIQKRDQLSTVI